MHTLVFPHRTKVANPYLHDLTAQSDHVNFEDWTPRRALRGGLDILHVHWPESIWNEQSLVRSCIRGVGFLALILSLSARGTSVVTTIHNLQPHDNPHPRLDRWFTGGFDRLVDRVQILSESSRSATVDRFGDGIEIDLVPMGSFVSNYERSDSAERSDLILHFGGLSAYKNTSHLLRVFGSTNLPDWKLHVAGKPATAELASDIAAIASTDPRVSLQLEHVDEADVPRLHSSASLAVLPFTAIENSSTVMLALSMGVPVLAPQLGSLPSLQAEVGDSWLRLYDGTLTAGILESAASWATATQRPERPDLSLHDWDFARHALLTSYRKARSAKSRS